PPAEYFLRAEQPSSGTDIAAPKTAATGSSPLDRSVQVDPSNELPMFLERVSPNKADFTSSRTATACGAHSIAEIRRAELPQFKRTVIELKGTHNRIERIDQSPQLIGYFLFVSEVINR